MNNDSIPSTTTTTTISSATTVDVLLLATTTAKQQQQFSISTNIQLSTGDVALIASTIFALATQLLLFRPLYRVAFMGREALLIVLYKVCSTTPTSLQTILGILLVTTPPVGSLYAWTCISLSAKLATKLLILLFAFCRFWAVMLPYQYARTWKARRIHLYAIITLCIASIIGSLAGISLAQRRKDFFADMFYHASFIAVHLAFAFCAIALIKLAVLSCANPSLDPTMENDRIKMTLICTASLLPMLIDQLPYYINTIGNIFAPNSKPILITSSSPLLLANDILKQGFDEYALLLICADFRHEVKRELASLLLVENLLAAYKRMKLMIGNNGGIGQIHPLHNQRSAAANGSGGGITAVVGPASSRRT